MDAGTATVSAAQTSVTLRVAKKLSMSAGGVGALVG